MTSAAFPKRTKAFGISEALPQPAEMTLMTFVFNDFGCSMTAACPYYSPHQPQTSISRSAASSMQ
jgi:hypothetical protein